jgi:uncharacterized protein YjiS (DUF1127 family)
MSSLHNAFLLLLMPTSFPVQASSPVVDDRAPRRRTAVFASLAAAVKRAVTALVRWRQREAIRQELMGMDDHLLADIGLRRDEIPLLFSERLRLHTPNPVRPWPVSAKASVPQTMDATDQRPMAA